MLDNRTEDLPMRLIRPRFTVSRLMVAVAIAGILIGIERLYERRLACLNRALEHAQREIYAQKLVHASYAAATVAELGGIATDAQSWRKKASSRKIEFVYHGSMKRKYERAARYPWLAITPDPPEPE